MNRLQIIAAISLTLSALGGNSARAGADVNGQLLGVSVAALWSATNPVNIAFLTNEPTFEKRGTDYVGSSSLNAAKPDTKEPIGVEITWTVSVLDERAADLKNNFPLPDDAQYLVTGHYANARAKTTVDTYSVVSVRSGNLVPQNLGYKQGRGRYVRADGDFERSVFEALGIRGPVVTRIVIPE
jgi:hypothetical protein